MPAAQTQDVTYLSQAMMLERSYVTPSAGRKGVDTEVVSFIAASALWSRMHSRDTAQSTSGQGKLDTSHSCATFQVVKHKIGAISSVRYHSTHSPQTSLWPSTHTKTVWEENCYTARGVQVRTCILTGMRQSAHTNSGIPENNSSTLPQHRTPLPERP